MLYYYMADFRDKVQVGRYFAELLQLAWPGASTRQELELVGNRVQLRSLWLWKNGREWPPTWAVEMVKAAAFKRRDRIDTVAARVHSGPGRKGNRANLKPFRQAA